MVDTIPCDIAKTAPAFLRTLRNLHGDRDAIVDAAGSATFSELDDQAAVVARGLLASGVTKGARVGILMPNGRDYLAALFGTLQLGAVAVLMSTLARPRELLQMLRLGSVDTLLTADRYLRNDYRILLEDALPGLAHENGGERFAIEAAPFLRSIWIWGDSPPEWSYSARSLSADSATLARITPAMLDAAQDCVAPADPAIVIFTSGSSAEPKAVVHSQGSIVRQGKALAALMGGCGPGDRMLSTMPFFWVGGLCTVVLAAFCSGTAVLCPRDPTAQATMDCLDANGATHIMHWPQQLDLMKDDPRFSEQLGRMRPAYAHQLELFGLATAAKTPNTLGMTETMGPHSMMPLGPLESVKAGSFGMAVGGIERRIVDPETGEPLECGNFGLLCLRGGSLLMGMLGKAHEEVFDADGFYRTDDIAMIDQDGHLFFRGRGGDIVKINGANVSPVEIEGVLRSLQGVKAASVAGIVLGEDPDEITLAAALVPEEGVSLDTDAINQQLRVSLSSYKVPRHLIVMNEQDLPMTATSKIYKPRLKEMLLDRIEAASGGT